MAAAAAGNTTYSIIKHTIMQSLSFEAWKKAVLEKVANAGFGNTELDEDMLYMAYDMEEKSVEEAADECIASLRREAD